MVTYAFEKPVIFSLNWIFGESKYRDIIRFSSSTFLNKTCFIFSLMVSTNRILNDDANLILENIKFMFHIKNCSYKSFLEISFSSALKSSSCVIFDGFQFDDCCRSEGSVISFLKTERTSSKFEVKGIIFSLCRLLVT